MKSVIICDMEGLITNMNDGAVKMFGYPSDELVGIKRVSIFSPGEISKYSGKIKSICDQIIGSTGVVMIYSQYIDGGLVPIALALEEL